MAITRESLIAVISDVARTGDHFTGAYLAYDGYQPFSPSSLLQSGTCYIGTADIDGAECQALLYGLTQVASDLAPEARQTVWAGTDNWSVGSRLNRLISHYVEAARAGQGHEVQGKTGNERQLLRLLPSFKNIFVTWVPRGIAEPAHALAATGRLARGGK